MNRAIFSLLLALVMIQPACADEATDRIKSALASAIPGDTPDTIKPSSIPGLYEVTYGGTRIFYVSEDGRFLLTGDMFDLRQQTNLSERHRSTGRLAVLDKLGESSMIVYPAKGKEKHKVTVFTDIDCGYCRKFHQGMKEMNELGITVRYVSFPRSGINTPSFDKANAVWCSKDRNRAMDVAKADGKLDKANCSSPVVQHMKLGAQLGVNGTPALILDDGRMLPGYLPPQRLAQLLDNPQ